MRDRNLKSSAEGGFPGNFAVGRIVFNTLASRVSGISVIGLMDEPTDNLPIRRAAVVNRLVPAMQGRFKSRVVLFHAAASAIV